VERRACLCLTLLRRPPPQHLIRRPLQLYEHPPSRPAAHGWSTGWMRFQHSMPPSSEAHARGVPERKRRERSELRWAPGSYAGLERKRTVRRARARIARSLRNERSGAQLTCGEPNSLLLQAWHALREEGGQGILVGGSATAVSLQPRRLSPRHDTTSAGLNHLGSLVEVEGRQHDTPARRLHFDFTPRSAG